MSMRARSAVRARESRDFTVPTEILRIVAASLITQSLHSDQHQNFAVIVGKLEKGLLNFR